MAPGRKPAGVPPKLTSAASYARLNWDRLRSQAQPLRPKEPSHPPPGRPQEPSHPPPWARAGSATPPIAKPPAPKARPAAVPEPAGAPPAKKARVPPPKAMPAAVPKPAASAAVPDPPADGDMQRPLDLAQLPDEKRGQMQELAIAWRDEGDTVLETLFFGITSRSSC